MRTQAAVLLLLLGGTATACADDAGAPVDAIVADQTSPEKSSASDSESDEYTARPPFWTGPDGIFCGGSMAFEPSSSGTSRRSSTEAELATSFLGASAAETYEESTSDPVARQEEPPEGRGGVTTDITQVREAQAEAYARASLLAAYSQDEAVVTTGTGTAEVRYLRTMLRYTELEDGLAVSQFEFQRDCYPGVDY